MFFVKNFNVILQKTVTLKDKNYNCLIINKLIIILTFLLQASFISAQNKELEKLSYIQLENRIDSLINNPKESIKYINFYIKKSKKEKNFEALNYAYRYASNSYSSPINIKYADSSLYIGNKYKSKKILTEAYLNKGMILMYENFYNEALNNIIIANNYAKQINDEYISYKCLYFISQNKNYLGLNKEANLHLKNCIIYFRNNCDKIELGKDFQTYYLYSLMSYIDNNSTLKNNAENKTLIKEAYHYIDEKKLNNYLPYFVSCEGENFYYLGNYNLAISKLKKAISLYNDRWPHFTEIYYLGLSYWKLNNKTEAVKYFEKLDKEYYIGKNQDPQFRPAYELLIEYYKSKNNTEKQLEYINKLMILDQSYEKNYKYLFAKISKDYDTKKLTDEKNNIEDSLKMHRNISIAIILFSILVLTFISIKYYQIKQRYQQKFNEIIAENNSEKDNLITKNYINQEEKIQTDFYNKISGLSETITENILKQLELFETNKEFLDVNITQKFLSEKVGTNINYLSKIINVYKQKNFNNYINDLKLEYILEKLKTDTAFLNKDVKELANIAGFNNAEGFSDNFKRKFDMKPSVFIKMMKENIKNSSQLHNLASDSENV